MSKLITTFVALTVFGATSVSCNSGATANQSSVKDVYAAASPNNTANSNSAATASPSAAASETEVREFLDDIYAPYAVEGGETGDWESVLEPELAAAVATEEGRPDANPFIDAQDWTPFRARYDNITVKGDRAIATAKFDNGGTQTSIDYQLMRTAAGWRVYDIQNAAGDSLRERAMNAAQ